MEVKKHSSQRIVCYSDILGFSPKFRGMPSDQKYHEYNQIIETLRSACHYSCDYRVEPAEFSLKRSNFYWFSDTFILFSDEFSFNDPAEDEFLSFDSDELVEDLLLDFLRSVRALFLRFLYFGFPLRGGVDYGEFIADPPRNIYIGEALIRAYKCSDKHAWAGISILPALSSRINQFQRIKKLLTTYKVPTKNGRYQEMSVIDWPSDQSINTKEDPGVYIANQFRKYCETLNPDAEQYCNNTIAFLKTRKG